MRGWRGVVAAVAVAWIGSRFTPEASGSETLRFPRGFKWCVATAAHQIEGGNTDSDWWAWENLPPKCDASGCRCTVVDCEKSGAAADHWNRLEEDTRLLKELGVKQYRFSLEWAKIEPRRGEWDWAAVAHYRHEILLLKEAGVEPMITLQHFTLPLWAQDLGGWRWMGMPSAFERYTDFVYREIAPGVRDWVTINEPMVHLGGGYALGLTPPGCGPRNPGCRWLPDETASLDNPYLGATPTREDIARVVAPAVGLLKAHAAAYRALHRAAAEIGREARVGMAHHLRVFDPKTGFSPLDWVVAGVLDQLWNWTIPDALVTGRLRISLPFIYSRAESVDGIAGTQDFFGVNYYTRDLASFEWKDGGVSVGIETREGASVNDLGWEIYPKGIYRLLHDVTARYGKLPVLITENGLADRHDSLRAEFIRRHLRWVHRAIEDGVPVEGYCHWSLLDNFEWVEGFSPRFGLYETDYSTQARTPRGSARFFSEVTRGNGFDF